MPPAELEAVLVSHPKVKDAGVIGVPMDDGGEAPKAFVVAEDGVDADELMAYVAERVAPYKQDPRGRVRRRDPEVGLRQDPAPRPARAAPQ